MAAFPQLSICSLISSDALLHLLKESLDSDRFNSTHFQQESEFCKFLEQEKHDIDCLVLESSLHLPQVACYLHKEAMLLPAIILVPSPRLEPANTPSPTADQPVQQAAAWHEDIFYHTAEIQLTPQQVPQIPVHIEQAIAQFLKLNPGCRLPLATANLSTNLQAQGFLGQQQQRLSDKLKERLGYFGVYYKRDPQLFFRHLPEPAKQEFLDELRSDYRDIVLRYFNKETGINQEIDAFVTKAFFADISVAQVLELHMELMDTFAKQLRLEGRSEDILLDYRLTLIDVIAHLCEMYRRSIPRES